MVKKNIRSQYSFQLLIKIIMNYYPLIKKILRSVFFKYSSFNGIMFIVRSVCVHFSHIFNFVSVYIIRPERSSIAYCSYKCSTTMKSDLHLSFVINMMHIFHLFPFFHFFVSIHFDVTYRNYVAENILFCK